MPITVSMIEEKEFKIKMKGYDPVEVDEFLDAICDEMVAMQEEISGLQNRLSQASRAGGVYTPVPTPVPAPAMASMPAPAAKAPAQEENGEVVQRMLARAQKFYDETVAEARAEAEKILNDAHVKVDSGVSALEEEKKALTEEVEMLRAAARDYRERFQRLIQDQQHVLNSEKQLFE